MRTTQLVTTLEELVALTPLFLEGYRAMNKKGKVFEVDESGFVQTLVGILNTQPENGIMVLLHDKQPIGYGAAFNDTHHNLPTYFQKLQNLFH